MGFRAAGAIPPPSERSVAPGSSALTRLLRSPARAAAAKARTTVSCSALVTRRTGACLTRARAEAASCRHAAGLRPTAAAISGKGSWNTSCRTNATRSAGVIPSRTTSKAMLTESSRVALCSGSSSASVNAE